jgi:hypothetical protein
MVARCQAALAEGEAVSVDDYMRLKQEALASRTRLLGEPVERATGIQVELIPAPAQYTKLKDENAALKLQLAAYQSGQNPHSGATAAGASGVASGVPQSVASDSQAAATPAPDNVVVPLVVESREAKVARLRRQNGDGPQACRSAFSDIGMYHEGRGRFDFPTGRGGW